MESYVSHKTLGYGKDTPQKLFFRVCCVKGDHPRGEFVERATSALPPAVRGKVHRKVWKSSMHKGRSIT